MRGGWFLVLAVVLLAPACGGPDVGSRDDLDQQIDALNLPGTLVEVDEHYTDECPEGLPCPTLVRWFDLSAPAQTVRPEILSSLEAAGVEYHETGSVDLISGRDGDYMVHVILEQSMLDQNEFAPPGTKAEVVVSVLDSD